MAWCTGAVIVKMMMMMMMMAMVTTTIINAAAIIMAPTGAYTAFPVSGAVLSTLTILTLTLQNNPMR